MPSLPNALIADIASIIGEWHSHTEIDIMFTRLGAPGDPPVGNKIIKVQTWLRRANGKPRFDAVPLLGGVLEELMDREVTAYNQEFVERKRTEVVRALARHGLSYQRGGVILGATLSTPSRSVEDLIRKKNLSELQKEFDRALANVESDPPSAITAACAILESTFKVIITDKALTMPGDQSILPLWRVVQAAPSIATRGCVRSTCSASAPRSGVGCSGNRWDAEQHGFSARAWSWCSDT